MKSKSTLIYILWHVEQGFMDEICWLFVNFNLDKEILVLDVYNYRFLIIKAHEASPTTARANM